MILDSSAIVAVLRSEPDAPLFAKAISSAECRTFSRITVEPVTPRQAEIARQAYRDFGKGRHKAGLNFGDCFAYALAKELDEPLLFKGDDFRCTDIEAGL